MKQKAKEEDTGNRKSMARAGFMAGLAHTTHAFDIRMPFTHLLLGVVCAGTYAEGQNPDE